MRSASSGRATRESHRASSPASLAEALRVRPLAAALKSGTIAADGLLELRRNRFGESLLREDEFQRPAWEAVRQVWSQPDDPPGVQRTARRALGRAAGRSEGAGSNPARPVHGERPGNRSRPLIPADRRVDEFSQLLAAMERTGATLPAAERAELLFDWCEAAPATAVFPPALHWLLHAGSADAFRALVQSRQVSARLAGLAACLALFGPAGWAIEPAFLRELPTTICTRSLPGCPISTNVRSSMTGCVPPGNRARCWSTG